MGLFDKRKSRKRQRRECGGPVCYDENDCAALEEYIGNTFGSFSNVFHEIVSPDIHVDIAVVEPNERFDGYTLVTMGMGARRMNIPDDAPESLAYVELAAYLPKDWNLKSGEESWYWPIRWLKLLARLPLNEDSWLGAGHTVANGGPFAEDTALDSVLLIDAIAPGNELVLPGGRKINFYTMVPLYEEESVYKQRYGAEALLSLFEEKQLPFPPVIDKNRRNVCQ